jgi:hypothetical protein
VRRWLDNYKQLKDALEEICEINHRVVKIGPGA